jgi:hypothetical protein
MNILMSSLPALVLLSTSMSAGEAKAVSNAEIFSQIHTKEAIHLQMQPGFYEFRLYRLQPDSASFLLEYRSETGKSAVFECDSKFTQVKLVTGSKAQKNHLQLIFRGQAFRYTGSTNAYYLEGVTAKP